MARTRNQLKTDNVVDDNRVLQQFVLSLALLKQRQRKSRGEMLKSLGEGDGTKPLMGWVHLMRPTSP